MGSRGGGAEFFCNSLEQSPSIVFKDFSEISQSKYLYYFP